MNVETELQRQDPTRFQEQLRLSHWPIAMASGRHDVYSSQGVVGAGGLRAAHEAKPTLASCERGAAKKHL